MVEETSLCIICRVEEAEEFGRPCNCQGAMCIGCFDKSLAKSFNNTGQMRCPTCRCGIKVDFDSETGKPTFSLDPVDQHPDNTRCRITRQLRPYHVRLFQEFGLANPLPWHEDNDVALNQAIITRLHTEFSRPPSCVCGSTLKRISLQERQQLFLEQAEAWAFSERLSPVLQHGVSIVCDMCESRITSDGSPGVWVCENKDNTITHATSLDICETCFIFYAWILGGNTRIQEAPAAAGSEPHSCQSGDAGATEPSSLEAQLATLQLGPQQEETATAVLQGSGAAQVVYGGAPQSQAARSHNSLAAASGTGGVRVEVLHGRPPQQPQRPEGSEDADGKDGTGHR